MRVNLKTYENSKPFILSWFDKQEIKNVERTISTLSQSLGIPTIAIAYYIGDHTNWQDPKCEDAIRRYIKFYRYTQIENKPSGSPL